MKIQQFILGAGLVLGFGGLLAAAEAENKNTNPRFAALDANHDGRLSEVEFMTSVRAKQKWWQRGEQTAQTDQNALTPGMFAALDRNHDAFISAEEWETGQSLFRQRGDNGEGASRTRNATPPGDPNRSQKSESDTTKPR